MSKLIGAYTVVQALVRDGEAYLAKSADGRSCTLRVVDVPEDDERLERVRAETLACAALHHPAVGVIADVFAHDGKTAIVGPEPVDGVLLSELLEKVGSKKLSESEVWYIGMQIAAAISLAHSTEVDGDFIPVCHGHLSPSHVSIGYDGTVRVEGLGLGHLVGESGLAAEDAYTAPEQRGGGRITPRGDIYSVAAILWEMLAGTPPRESVSLSDVAASVPDSFMDAFGRALESKVSKRRITSMELEQFLGELVDISSPGQGKKALGASMMVFKKGRTLLGHTHGARTAAASAKKEAPNLVDSGPITQRGGTRKLGGAIGGRSARASGAHKVPPIRSKQSTLTGSTGAPRARMDSLPIDWDAASKSASDTVSPPALGLIDDELSWGAEEDDNLANLVPTPSAGERHAIADEDSDEEMTMMNPAGVELRAAMDEAKAKRDAGRGKRKSKRNQDAQQEETTLVRSRRKLERTAAQEQKRDAKLASLTRGDSDPPEGEERTVMRDEPEISLSEDSVPPARSSGSGATAPPRPRPSNRSLPRASDPSRLGERDARPDSKAELTRTLASAGVDEDDLDQPPSEPQPATKKAAFDDEDEKTKPVAKRVIDIGAPRGTLPSELDSAVIPLPAAPESRPTDDEGARDSSPIELDRPNRVEPTPAPVEKAAGAIASRQDAGSSVQAQAPSTASNAPSPWDKNDASDEPEPGPKPIPTAMAALIIVVTMVVVMVIGVLVLRETSTVGPAPSLPPDGASGAAATSGAPKPAAPKPTSKPRPSATGSAKASASAPSGAVAPPDVDPSALPMTMGYLTVIYQPDPEAIVSVLGKDIGKVGVPNQVLCTRPSFVRLKSGARWVNEGQTVTVKCRAITTIEVK